MWNFTTAARRITDLGAATAFAACANPAPLDPGSAVVAAGEELFFNETFQGNGRTCGTCHRREDNFALTPAFIATLPDDDPLFVAETNPALAENFEKPLLMRQFGLILENLDGFDDLENDFVLRGIPHVLALRNSIESPHGPRTGWSGDGSPGDGSLRSFADGAVIQHFPRTLNRTEGVGPVAVPESTRIWLDRNPLGLGNASGSFADCQRGRIVEVAFEDPELRRTAAWIKVLIESHTERLLR